MPEPGKYYGMLVDLFTGTINPSEITVENGIIRTIKKTSEQYNSFILPGWIDSHIHIESSLLSPSNFSRIAVSHGTIGVVADPHEIANVLGLDGIKYMIENAEKSDVKFFFGAPSCVPATKFESNGAELGKDHIETLFKDYNLFFLSEVMNFPDVIKNDRSVIEKIELALKYKRNIDGHAPGLNGDDLQAYIDKGIQTDHESVTLHEAQEKISRGMMIQIREGSAARNFDAIYPLIDLFPDKVMLCSDDLHPEELLNGHINKLIIKAVGNGINLFNILKAASVNPVKHYNLNIGLLRVNDRADFLRISDLKNFEVIETVIAGKIVYSKFEGLKSPVKQKLINKFNAVSVNEKDLRIHALSTKIKVISVKDQQLVTGSFIADILPNGDDIDCDLERDILKLVVINRYSPQKPAVAFIHNFNLKKGALASSVSHDSHNIISVGTSNDSIARCVNWIIQRKGGIVIDDGSELTGIPLPIAGLMSTESAEIVSETCLKINKIAAELGCKLTAPLMTLSFMSLLVIPELKLSDKGLFDVSSFNFTCVFD